MSKIKVTSPHPYQFLGGFTLPAGRSTVETDDLTPQANVFIQNLVALGVLKVGDATDEESEEAEAAKTDATDALKASLGKKARELSDDAHESAEKSSTSMTQRLKQQVDSVPQPKPKASKPNVEPTKRAPSAANEKTEDEKHESPAGDSKPAA